MRLPRLPHLLVAVLLMAASVASHANPQVQTIWRLLDYVAVDYPEAVQGGAVVNPLEYDEMLEFSSTVRERLAQLPPLAARDGVVAQAKGLEGSIERTATSRSALRSSAVRAPIRVLFPTPGGPVKPTIRDFPVRG